MSKEDGIIINPDIVERCERLQRQQPGRVWETGVPYRDGMVLLNALPPFPTVPLRIETSPDTLRIRLKDGSMFQVGDTKILGGPAIPILSRAVGSLALTRSAKSLSWELRQDERDLVEVLDASAFAFLWNVVSETAAEKVPLPKAEDGLA